MVNFIIPESSAHKECFVDKCSLVIGLGIFDGVCFSIEQWNMKIFNSLGENKLNIIFIKYFNLASSRGAFLVASANRRAAQCAA